MSDKNKFIGIIGAGSFGLAIAELLSDRNKVMMYVRNHETMLEAQKTGKLKDFSFDKNVTLTNNVEELASSCSLIFPVVPSNEFRNMCLEFSPYLNPAHILIHATKGLDVNLDLTEQPAISRENIRTMSELIQEETSVVRVGCLAGPNLAREILDKLPAATVIASRFNEVVRLGQNVLRSSRFQTYGSNDILGIELAGVLKNYMAIASGIISGRELGENARSMLITRGLTEMIYLGRRLGASTESFLGVAGIGDLIATCTSPKSRNYSVGFRLAKGESLDQILADMNEVAEGVRTVQIMKGISETYEIVSPIVHTLYRIMFEGMSIEAGLRFLMRYPAYTDAEFMRFYQEKTDWS